MLDLKIPVFSNPISTAPKVQWAEVDEQGRLVLPAEVAAQFGLTPGARARIDTIQNGLRLHRPATHLTKVYVEPTIDCNLDCITCFRHGWDEPQGKMTEATFAAVLAGLAELEEMPTVYFGGIGEPLVNRHTVEWIVRTKALGARVEMITNGTLLTERRSRELIDAGLDVLWVSIDGASPESYADVRLGAELPRVLENLKRFRRMRKGGHYPKPEIGITFVAMRRNIADLPRVLQMGKELGAMHFNVSNVLPVTEALQADTLYARTLRNLAYLPGRVTPRLSLPKMEFNELTREALMAAFQSGYSVNYAGNNWGDANDACNYVESGTLSVAYNGDVSPCWPLMHTHTTYLNGKPRQNYKHAIANVRDRGLREIWLDPAYVAYREKVQSFAFAPCTYCGGCEMSEENLEDCYGNTAPACGGCVWAQGVVQCP